MGTVRSRLRKKRAERKEQKEKSKQTCTASGGNVNHDPSDLSTAFTINVPDTGGAAGSAPHSRPVSPSGVTAAVGATTAGGYDARGRPLCKSVFSIDSLDSVGDELGQAPAAQCWDAEKGRAALLHGFFTPTHRVLFAQSTPASTLEQSLSDDSFEEDIDIRFRIGDVG